MNNAILKHIGLLSLVLLWLGSTNHCVLEALFSPHAAHADNSNAHDTTPTQPESTPCHDADPQQHPCGVPCTNAGPVHLKISQQETFENLSLPPMLPKFQAGISGLSQWPEFPLKRPDVFRIDPEALSLANRLLLLALRAPNAPPPV